MSSPSLVRHGVVAVTAHTCGHTHTHTSGSGRAVKAYTPSEIPRFPESLPPLSRPFAPASLQQHFCVRHTTSSVRARATHIAWFGSSGHAPLSYPYSHAARVVHVRTRLACPCRALHYKARAHGFLAVGSPEWRKRLNTNEARCRRWGASLPCQCPVKVVWERPACAVTPKMRHDAE